MAQSKNSNRPSRPNQPAKKSAGSAKPGVVRPAGQRPAGSARPPARKPGKSIVNQKQTPWGLIATVLVLVLFAGGIVAYAVTRKSSSTSASDAYTQPETAAAKKIKGLVYKAEPNHTHTAGTVKYDMSPPVGGNHSSVWALCNGVVYNHQIANENAVHMLEHGAVWITYNPKTISAKDLATLKSAVSGVNYLALSPYAGLSTPVSLQAWNYQLKLTSATDSRLQQFIDMFRYPSSNTPEPGAGCTGSGFVASKSTLGHPYNG